MANKLLHVDPVTPHYHVARYAHFTTWQRVATGPVSKALNETMIRTSFINVDLELYSKDDLSSIASELEGKIYLLTNENVDDVYNLAFECFMNDPEPSAVIERFLVLIEQLSDDSALLLASCDRKIFDIGYDSGDDGLVYNELSNELLRKVSALGFDIRVTVYPISESDEQ